jgi:flagella basal body P-ring formation protein FlgA
MAPLVAKSERVRVRLSTGAIDLETVAIASRDAVAGEVIRVRTQNEERSYAARVTGPGAVQALWR